MRKWNIFLGVCLISIGLVSCNKDKPEVASTAVEVTTSEATTQQAPAKESHKGEVKSLLTGQWVDKKIGNRRPVAIMLNNIKVAMPQSGIANADVIYEILVEGGITRLLGIFEDYDSLDKIGPVRSARHYYVDIADEYQGIYTHYGETKYAVTKMNQLGIDTLSGLSSLGNTIFYRDNSRKAPHNAYIGSSGIKTGIDKKEYTQTYKSPYKGHFGFSKSSQKLSGDKADKITLNFSSLSAPWFEYDASSKLYKRFQYGGEQIDDQTGKQIAYRNVIVQFVKEWNIDKNGYQTMDLIGSGKGYYATLGKFIPITWNKESQNSITRYYNASGKEIKLNPGKTWVAVFPRDKESNVIFE